MKRELIIIKNKTSYIRFKNDNYRSCSFDKASVFPIEQLDSVKEHIANLKKLGFEDVCIKKLVITEGDI